MFYNQHTNQLRAGWSILLVLVVFFVVSGFLQWLLTFGGEFPFRGVLAQGMAVWIVLLLTAELEHRSLKEFGVFLPNASSFIRYLGGWMLGVASIGAIVAAFYFLDWAEFSIKPNYSWKLGWIYLVMMIGVGWYEELLMRGFLLTRLYEGLATERLPRWVSMVGAVGISSGIFAFAHILNPEPSGIAMSNIFLAGIMLSIPYVCTGSLSVSMAIHGAWNWVQGGVFGMPVSGNQPLESIYIYNPINVEGTGGQFGPEGSLLTSVVLVLVILILGLLYRNWFPSIINLPFPQKDYVIDSGNQMQKDGQPKK